MSPTLQTEHITVLKNQTVLPILARWAVAFAVMVTKWERRQKTRNHLARLTDHQLDDIGISRSQARTETNKAFWQY